MWVEPDCNLIGGESWVRQILYGKRYFKEKFGVDVELGWNPDSFGYNWNMPQFFSKSGINTFITQKISWNDTNVFPYHLFWWESPDGSRVLSYILSGYTNTIDNPFEMIDFVRRFEANTGFRDVLFMFGMGDHGGGPTWEMLKRIEALKDVWVFPKIKFTTLEHYFNIIKRNDTIDIPVWKDEIYLEYHRSTYTTQAKTKKWNRDSEVLLTNAEKFSVFAGVNGQTKLETAWKNVLFNQFHDILSGTCIPSVLPDVYEKYEKAREVIKDITRRAIEYPSLTFTWFNVSNRQEKIVFREAMIMLEKNSRLVVVAATEKDRVLRLHLGTKNPSVDASKEVIKLAKLFQSHGFKVTYGGKKEAAGIQFSEKKPGLGEVREILLEY